jgi:4-hydroxy-3-methylbut-2-enyl diphosphate reductase
VSSGRLLVLTPLRLEGRAVAAGSPEAEVVHTGPGARRAAETARRLAPAGQRPVAVMGVAGAVAPDLSPGDLVVADRVLAPDGSVAAEMPSAPLLAAALARSGVPTRVGPVLTCDHLVRGPAARRALAAGGALAVDLESAVLAAAGWGGPVAVVRAVSDTAEQELISPAIVAGGRRALASLRRAAPVVSRWAAATGPRTVFLAGPRSFCAGVERAVKTVERALDRFGSPVYVRRQIVHNRHVVADLEARGAVFVNELDEVPDGARVVFSAHGVSPTVRADAQRRQLGVIDATCPLVAKVHTEVRRFRSQGYQVVLVGHRGHDEVEGTLGEDPDMILVETVEDVAGLRTADASRVAYTTQTTLATDETAELVGALRHRFPQLTGPHAQDICYASQNRQEAIRAVAGRCDLVVVVGSANSSNTARLAEVARRCGARAEVIDDESHIDLGWLEGARTVAITAGASAPEHLVQSTVTAVAGLGPVRIEHHDVTSEHVNFPLPLEVR